jgi:hypothetical protein
MILRITVSLLKSWHFRARIGQPACNSNAAKRAALPHSIFALFADACNILKRISCLSNQYNALNFPRCAVRPEC